MDVIDDIGLYYDEIFYELDQHFEIVIQFFAKKLGFTFSNNHTIYILPCFLHISHTFNNICFYGTEYKYPHIINILHELMHCYFEDDDISHSIIELSTNGALLVAVSKGKHFPLRVSKGQSLLVAMKWRKKAVKASFWGRFHLPALFGTE